MCQKIIGVQQLSTHQGYIKVPKRLQRNGGGRAEAWQIGFLAIGQVGPEKPQQNCEWMGKMMESYGWNIR